jgi:hypothetical protein
VAVIEPLTSMPLQASSTTTTSNCSWLTIAVRWLTQRERRAPIRYLAIEVDDTLAIVEQADV